MTTTMTYLATSKQVSFIEDLLKSKSLEGLDSKFDGLTETPIGTLTKKEASEVIDALKAQPWKPKAPATAEPLPQVPASKYALVTSEGVMEFFQVDRPTKGKWAGYQFTKKLIGAPGDWRKIRVRGEDERAVLEAIVSDVYLDSDSPQAGGKMLTGPEASAVRYSRNFTRCACCESPLSDPVSIAQGLGPVCVTRFSVSL